MKTAIYIIITLFAIVIAVLIYRAIWFRIQIFYYTHPISEGTTYSPRRDFRYRVQKTLSGDIMRDTSILIEHSGQKHWDMVSEWTFSKNGTPIRYSRSSFSRGLYYQQGWDKTGKMCWYVTYTDDSTSSPDTVFSYAKCYNADSILQGYDIRYSSKKHHYIIGKKSFSPNGLVLKSKVY
jgi:hypothetical protein